MRKLILLILLTIFLMPGICFAVDTTCEIKPGSYYYHCPMIVPDNIWETTVPYEDNMLPQPPSIKKLKYIQYQPVQYYFVEPDNRIYPLIGFMFKTGMCIWAFNQKSTFGNVSGVVFGIGACYNFYEVAW